MSAPRLPQEIIDMIIEFVFQCPQHRWATIEKPCANWHTPSQLPKLLPLRRVNKAFHERTTPALFSHLTCTGYHRNHLMTELSRHKLAKHVRVLRLELAPNDLGQRMRRVTASLISVDKKLLNYYEALRIYIAPILKRFRKVRQLHLQITYAGIYEREIPKNKLVGTALEEVTRAVKAATLKDLEELQIGVPYEGGYCSHFVDLDDERYQRLMRSTSRKIQTGTIRLYDRDGKFTTISCF